MKLILHIDGASRGNPGPAAVGVVLADKDGTVLAEVSEYIGETTNNVAEYQALLRGLQEAARLAAKDISVYGDSQLLIRQMSGVYRVRHPGLLPLYNEARNMVRSFSQVSFIHVPREENTRADELANRALDEQSKKIPVTKVASPTNLETTSQGSRPQQQRLLSVPQLTLNRVVISPGQGLVEQEMLTDTFLYVLSGEGVITVAEEKTDAEAGGTFFVPRYARCTVKTTGQKPLVVLVGRIPNTEGEK
jgi:ribonuclease HI